MPKVFFSGVGFGKKKPPPPPRRSKSYERPQSKSLFCLECNHKVSLLDPDIQQNYEEYDLSVMDSSSTKQEQNKQVTKRVSFQEEVTNRGIPTQKQIQKQENPNAKLSSFSSFKGEIANNTTTPTDSSMLGKLLKDSLVPASGETQPTRANLNENSTLTNIRTDYKYYF